MTSIPFSLETLGNIIAMKLEPTISFEKAEAVHRNVDGPNEMC
jgi:hypothetical protein